MFIVGLILIAISLIFSAALLGANMDQSEELIPHRPVRALWDPGCLPVMFSIDSSFSDKRILPITEECIDLWRKSYPGFCVPHGEISSGSLLTIQPDNFIDTDWPQSKDSLGYTRLFLKGRYIRCGEIYLNDSIASGMSDKQLRDAIFNEIGYSLGVKS